LVKLEQQPCHDQSRIFSYTKTDRLSALRIELTAFRVRAKAARPKQLMAKKPAISPAANIRFNVGATGGRIREKP
jgi:hypothetical protein